MATGAIFSLITNDGKQDRMLMATGLLNTRMSLIEDARGRDPSVLDPTPTLLDIEKTHIVFVNAHFKPFAALGFEYNKVTVSNTSLGQNVLFSIPQFGDFFNDMCVYVKLTAPTVAGGTLTRTDLLTDATRANAPAVRWCSYPGERLFKSVKFTVNGNPLDDYQREVYNFFREFCVQPGKQAGWDRLMGQESVNPGYLRQTGVDRTTTTQGSTGASGGVAGISSYRVSMNVANGYQTPKVEQSDLEMLIPLLFWFNLDPRLSIPSVSIPFGQRYISIDLASQNEMIGLVPRGTGTWTSPRGTITDSSVKVDMRMYINNIFVNPEVHDIFIRRIGFTLIRVHRFQNKIVTAGDEFQLNNFKWPIESMYVGAKPSVQEASTANSLYLDRWHTFSHRTVQTGKLDGVAGTSNWTKLTGTVAAAAGTTLTGTSTVFTTELAVGDVVNIVGITTAGTTVTYHQATITVITSDTAATFTPAVAGGIVAASYVFRMEVPVTEYETQSSPLTKLTISAHGIPLYNDLENLFYNAYQPFVFGGSNIKTPNDNGLYMINFSLYPRTYQPSGHVNVSRAREFFIKYSVSANVTTSASANLMCLGIAINFLLISDGSAVLRYST